MEERAVQYVELPATVRPRSVAKNFCIVTVTSNLAAHACSTKYRRKKKLITQLIEKLRDETFEPN